MFCLVLLLCLRTAFSIHLPPVYPEDSSFLIKDGDTFDFIVIGAGASGCVVAARLTEFGATVLLVEAGDNPDIRSRVPSLSCSLLASNVDWQYPTIPNGKSCLSSQEKQCVFSRGKMLGGSTSMNYMMYTRGNRKDYDSWNIHGWAWDDLEKYFLKFENLKSLEQMPALSRKYHSTNGSVAIEFFVDSQNEWHKRIIQGYHNLGLPYNTDVNAHSQIGVSQINGYVDDGERESAAKAYLSPAVKRQNLYVIKNAHATKVILDAQNVAVGVKYVWNNKEINVFARKEVILSAGAVASPQILMLSGIGPANHLKNMNIEVRVDSKDVGQGLSDHVLPLMILAVDRGFGVDFPNLIPFLDNGVDLTKWYLTKDGPYASNGLSDVTVFLNTDCYDFTHHSLLDKCKEECELPNLQFIHAYTDRNILTTVKEIFAKSTGLNDDIVNQLIKVNINNAFIVISPVLLNPKSRGWIGLNSSDPLKKPNIFANYLDSQYDVDELVKSFKIVEHLVETKPFKENNARIVDLKLKGCPKAKFGTDEYRKCYIHHMTHSVFHGVGTTALGSVVDASLKVKGVKNLRIADAGVMPSLPRGNTEAACLAIGEKAADLIRNEHRLNGKPIINQSKLIAGTLTSAPSNLLPISGL